MSSEVLCIAGGTGRVIKTVLKSKTTDKTLHADKSLYENAFKHAVQAHAATTMEFKASLKSLSKGQLQELKSYLAHDNTPKDKKFAKLAEFTNEYKDLEAVQSKLAVAMDTMRKMMLNDLEANFGDEDGVIVMEKVKDAITSRIAIVENDGMAD